MTQRLARRVLLLGWDGADWKLIKPLLDRGEMPHLARLVDEGVMGNLATLRPILSPMLWTSIATGMRADRHGILGFIEPRPDGSGVRPVSSTSLKAQPLWNIVEGAGLRSAVVNWFATHPADALAGVVVSNHFTQMRGNDFETSPLPDRSVSPARLRPVISDLRLHPAELDPDQLLYFVPRAREIDEAKDRRIATLARLLAHCASTHAAGTWLAEHEPWDLLAVYYNLIDLAGHVYMPYRPPAMQGVSAQDCEIYGAVVDHCYRFHDLMLGRYMRLVGPDTTIVIVSDHGFHSDHLRPRGPEGSAPDPEAWHREYGVFAARGPGIRRDELVFGASLLDVAPTVLTMLGLPAARDMQGRVLTRIFEDAVEPASIDSYGTPAPAVEEGEDDPWAAQRALRQLAALGYVEQPGEDASKAIEQAETHRLRNLAEVLFSAREHAAARDIFLDLLARRPNDTAPRLRLAQCLLQLDDYPGCRAIVDAILAERPNAPHALMLEGLLLFRQDDYEGALDRFQRIEAQGAKVPGLYYRMGAVYLRLKLWQDAERVLRIALELDEDHAQAYDGLGVALLRQGRVDEAVECLLRAIALLYFQPLAHFHLGEALAAAGRAEGAIRSFETALAQRPALAPAHDRLAAVYRARGDAATALFHRTCAEQLRRDAAAASPAQGA